MLEILFLGTGASIPSRDRGLPAMAIRSGGDIVLMDCGEGTQRQFMLSPFSFMKIKAICITHLHGDHFLGLSGLLLTMGLSGRKESITIAGPEGIEEILFTIISTCGDVLPFDVTIMEVSGDESFEVNNLDISVFKTDHTVPSVGFSLSEKDTIRIDARKAAEKRVAPEDISRIKKGIAVDGVVAKDIIACTVKGLKVVYTGDTKPCDEIYNASMGADVLVHEATFGSTETKMAMDHGHTTSIQAAEIAKKCDVRMLILTHISNRYKNRDPLLEEAMELFSNTKIAEDFMHISVTHKAIKLI
ncbi:MAG TPA: ribonuclease Z [Candidatus Methanomethylophilaceae archaeon]|nr:ribonuclease Z [Candidatus Methanomethylophilaceae archaeon]